MSERPLRLGERYRVEDLLGRGGMADVYRAHDDVLDRPVAVKVLRDVASRDRFRSEARTLARLSHPGLVTVLDAGVTQGLPWLVMTLVEGETLAHAVERGPLPPTRVADLGRRLADALDYVHEAGLVHRDVKPGNVLLAADGRVLLTDFGIARLVEGASLTEAGVTMGTAAYLAPEQVRGEPLTAAADVYALGLVLLEALTAQRAFPGAATEAALARLARQPAVPASVPAGWRRLLAEMTALDPVARPALASVADELRELGRGGTLPPRVADTAPLRTRSAPTVPLRTSDAGSTRALTSAVPAAGVRGRASASRHRRAAAAVALAAVVAVVVAAVVAVVVSASGGRTAPSTPRLPGTVPGPVRTDLQQLHQAVDGA